jgi:hypothetical protein
MKQILGKQPIQKSRQAGKDYGFGMWSDHEKMIDIPGYLRKLRNRNNHNL